MRLDGKLEQSAIVRRADRLRELSSERYESEAKKQIGLHKKVLVLKNAKQGLSRDFWNVELTGNAYIPGTEVDVKVTGLDSSNASRMDGVLVAELLQDSSNI
jgi:tRNA A37 methylthiotransferase MiaB